VKRERIRDLRATFTASELQVGASHPATLQARVRLALAYRDRGRAEHALAELELVVEIYDNTLGPQHPDTLAAPRGQTAAPATRPAMRPQARPSHPQAPDGPAMELRAADPAMRTR